MTHAATRARLLELKRDAEAARRGRDLLDEKREALLREVLARRPVVAAKRKEAAARLARARARLEEAETELGADAVDRAALAQRAEPPSVTLAPRRLAGARFSSVRLERPEFRIRWAAGGTSASLDAAAEAFGALVGPLAELAEAEAALTCLKETLAKTNRRLNALEKLVLPALAGEAARTAAALEEEERDQWVRCRTATRATTA